MGAVSRHFLGPILFCSCLSVASSASLDVKEIRFKSIGGYSENRFTLVIRNNGLVRYEGISFVATAGKRRSQISAQDFEKLVRKIEQIRFFKLEDRYDSYPLDKPARITASGEVSGAKTFVTDQTTEIVTVVASDRTKSIEDYMGAPKALFELEQLILDLTQARKWSGDEYDRDVPYYDKFPLHTLVTYRAVLADYRTSGDPRRISGYELSFVNNKGINFNVESSPTIDLRKFAGYLIDATGEIREAAKHGHKFVLAKIRPVRRYFEIKS